MLVDLVIDTNVLAHANNPENQHNSASINLIEALYSCSSLICVDEGFSIIEAENRSFIGSEYLENLVPGMLGYNVISYLASIDRVKIVTKRTSSQISRYINQRVFNNKDKIFLKVTFNSIEKVLISHDFTDFPTRLRTEFNRRQSICIFTADSGVDRLS